MSKKKKILIPGFQFAGLHCGIKVDSKKKDLAIIYSEEPDTLVEGVFTRNKVCAAPVTLCREVIKKGRARLVVINSGVANACTGKQGLKDSYQTQALGAASFNLKPEEVLVSSTGKIGNLLPMKAVAKGVKLARKDASPHGFMEAVRGIMTTDEYPKYAAVKGSVGGKKYTMAVLAKGAGMLRPDMATMLAYVVTDLKFSPKTLKTLFKRAVDITLNRITVDGDTSTNDTVLILANGRAGNKTFTADSPAGFEVEKNLTRLLQEMAKKIVLDGEGATKCCRVEIQGAKNDGEARKIAYAIGNSPLVKTALFGCDPNWGRVMAAVGYSGAQVVQEKIDMSLGPYKVVKNGVGAPLADPAGLDRYMKKVDLEIKVDLKLGGGKFFVFMSDLTYDYIHLNAEYHT